MSIDGGKLGRKLWKMGILVTVGSVIGLFSFQKTWIPTWTETSHSMESSTVAQVNRPAKIGTYYEATVPDTLDLAEVGRLGINHFMEITDEQQNYEMFWGIQKMCFSKEVMDFSGYGQFDCLGTVVGEFNPPFLNHWWSPLHACQPKAVEALAYERLMSGSQQLIGREARMVQMMADQVKDGIYWVSDDPDKTWLGPPEYRPHANVHGQGRMLRAMIAWYQYTGKSPFWKQKIDEMVEGLDRIAVHKDDYAYFPVAGVIPYEYFRSCYVRGLGWRSTDEPMNEKGGEEGSLFNHQGNVPGPLATWYRLTGHEKALQLSGKLVRFLTKSKFWADYKKGDYPGVYGPDHAHFTGHAHGHVNTLRSILEYALATNDSRLMQFVRDGYEWARQIEIARIGLVMDGQGCGCGRLIGLALKLTENGIGDYWEDIDLYVRNHGTEMMISPEDVSWLEKRSEGKPTPPRHPGYSAEQAISAMVGGFSNHQPPFKSSTSLCCDGLGQLGICWAWQAMLREDRGTVRVNLLLNRASPWLDVDSYLPYEGKVVFRNKSAREAFVRIPLWLDLSDVTCRVDNREIHPAWFGRYLRLEDLKAGQTIVIQFPVRERVEYWKNPTPKIKHLIEAIPKDVTFAVHFRGNTVTMIDPELMPESPLYRSRAEKYSASKAPLKTARRYTTAQVLYW